MIFTGRGKRKTEDRTYGNSSFYLITGVKKHDFVCSFFLCVMLADSSTPTSTYFKLIAILQIKHAVTDSGFPKRRTSNPRGGAPDYFLSNFPKNQKLHKMEKIGAKMLEHIPCICALHPTEKNSPMVPAGWGHGK